MDASQAVPTQVAYACLCIYLFDLFDVTLGQDNVSRVVVPADELFEFLSYNLQETLCILVRGLKQIVHKLKSCTPYV